MDVKIGNDTVGEQTIVFFYISEYIGSTNYNINNWQRLLFR